MSDTIVYFDCGSGVAGDMIVAALLDAGVPEEVVAAAVAAVPVGGYRITHTRVTRNAVSARRFVVEVTEPQPHRHYGDIVELLERADLDSAVRNLALGVFSRLADAEARVHGVDKEKVHFHEVGAVDSIVDIVAAAAALVHLDAEVTSSPVPVGSGTVTTAHGVLPLPAPATLLLLRGIPVRGTAVDAELTTPTGAAVLAEACTRFGPMHLVPRQVGVGAGSREGAGLPGVLRAVVGTRCDDGTDEDTWWEVRANIDDMSGQLAGHAIAALLQAGAADAWCTPIVMKKGRPAVELGMLCRGAQRDALCTVLLRETTTIGMRYHQVARKEMTRAVHTVETPYGPVRVKVSSGHGARNVHPEFADCQAAASQAGVPVKEVMAAAVAAWWRHA